jgi:hypothetical protein
MSTTFVGSPQRAARPVMSATTKRGSITQPVNRAGDLVVHRRDIQFHNATRDLVRIDVTVHNVGLARSAPAPLVLESAPFGAFVRWSPLATLRVPSIAPGGKATVSTLARAPRAVPIGDFDGVTPRRLLTATGGGDAERSAAPRVDAPAILARDLLEIVGRRTAHWTGNLNVFIGGRAVERHLARALRVYPGKDNLAMFLCGEGPDAYAFHLDGEGAEWNAKLFVPGRGVTLALARQNPIQPGDWVELPGAHPVIVCVTPPREAVRGEVEVHVRQRSSGESAVVELSLDADAAGPGCYTL